LSSRVPRRSDDISFVTAPAKHFRILDERRVDHATIFDQNETWCNAGEERRSI
ncbi:unnamed protein product, partial [Rotaria magnacalcarata]